MKNTHFAPVSYELFLNEEGWKHSGSLTLFFHQNESEIYSYKCTYLCLGQKLMKQNLIKSFYS